VSFRLPERFGISEVCWTAYIRERNKFAMDYTTILIDRSEDDKSGQELCDMIAAELTYLSNQGLDGFMLVPLQNGGTTGGVIIAARGESPQNALGRRVFQELTGLDDPSQLLEDENSN
jgi:hypothetical protein